MLGQSRTEIAYNSSSSTVYTHIYVYELQIVMSDETRKEYFFIDLSIYFSFVSNSLKAVHSMTGVFFFINLFIYFIFIIIVIIIIIIIIIICNHFE